MAAVPVLVFDGDCGFCAWSAGWLQRRAPQLGVEPWQTADLAALGLSEEACRSAVQFVGAEGTASGGRAVARALGEGGQPYRALGVLLGARLLAPLVESGYRVVARHRHRLPGSTAACRLDGDEGTLGGVGRDRAPAAVTPAER